MEWIERLTGTQRKIIFRELPQDDPKQRQPDITRAKAIQGWQPKISREEGLKITYSYFRSLPEEEQQLEHRTFLKVG